MRPHGHLWIPCILTGLGKSDGRRPLRFLAPAASLHPVVGSIRPAPTPHRRAPSSHGHLRILAILAGQRQVTRRRPVFVRRQRGHLYTAVASVPAVPHSSDRTIRTRGHL